MSFWIAYTLAMSPYVGSVVFNNWLLHKAFLRQFGHVTNNDTIAIACISSVPFVGTVVAISSWLDAKDARP